MTAKKQLIPTDYQWVYSIASNSLIRIEEVMILFSVPKTTLINHITRGEFPNGKVIAAGMVNSRNINNKHTYWDRDVIIQEIEKRLT